MLNKPAICSIALLRRGGCGSKKPTPAVGQGNDGGRIQKYSRLQKLPQLQKVPSHSMFRAFLQLLQFLQFK
jgi:hypothetical protein